MMKLYELTAEYRFLEDALVASVDDEHDDLQAKLDEIIGQVEAKAENVGKYILGLTAEAEGIKTEIDRLTARRGTISRKAEWLKSYLLSQMVAADIDKIKRDVLTVSVRVNPPSVQVEVENAIPTEFWRVIPESYEVDKKAVLEHVKATGEIVPGCHIVTDKKSLVIR